jgi:sec-independent protein translocase protein TatB
MFDVGFPELFIVAVLAIVVVGPNDLPKAIRSVMGMIRKVREMGSEFQAGVKKMADEVELDAVTRKLNEAGNVKIDEKSKDASTTNYSDYDEFDYDEYDYDGHNYEPPAPKKDETKAEDASEETVEESNVADAEVETGSEEKTPTEISDSDVQENAADTSDEDNKKVKSKADD